MTDKLDRDSIENAIKNVESKNNKLYESRFRPIRNEPKEDYIPQSKQVNHHSPRRKDKQTFAFISQQDKQDLPIRASGNATNTGSGGPVGLKFKPLPTDLKEIDAIVKKDRHEEKNSEDKFFWFGKQGIKKWFIILLGILLVIVLSGIVFASIFTHGASEGWFKSMLNVSQPVMNNNSNICQPVIQNVCNLSCGNTTFSPTILVQINGTNVS